MQILKQVVRSARRAKIGKPGEAGTQIVCVIGLAAMVFSQVVSRSFAPDSTTDLSTEQTAQVTVGAFQHVIRTEGQLRCYHPLEVRSECRWRLPIIELVPEGTFVKKGQVVCRLDASELEERARQRKVSLIRAESDLQAAMADDAMQESTNARLLEDARLAAETAQDELEAYRDAESLNELEEFQGQTRLSEESLELIRSDYEHARELNRRGLNTWQNLERARSRLSRAQRQLELAESNQRLFTNFQHPRQMLSLKSGSRRAQREVGRTTLRNSVASLKSHSYVLSRQARVNLYRNSYERYSKAVAACTMRAPKDGELLHANSWTMSSKGYKYIEVGRDVRHEQQVFSIIDRSRLKCKARVSDRVAPFLREGMTATVRVDSLPDRDFRARLTWKAPLSQMYSSHRPDDRVHDIEIVLDDEGDAIADLSPRMDCQVEILALSLRDVMQVPADSVIEHRGEFVVLVRSDSGLERRTIQTGHRTDEQIQIVSGVTIGEQLATGHPEELRELADSL